MTDQIPAEVLVESLKIAMLGTTDGGFIEPESEIPAGEMFRLAAEWVQAHAPFLRPEPSEDERDALRRELIRGIALTGPNYENVPVNDCPDDDPPGEPRPMKCVPVNNMTPLVEHLLAAGFTRRAVPSREQVARVIYDCDDLERAVLADAESIADAVLALFKGGEG